MNKLILALGLAFCLSTVAPVVPVPVLEVTAAIAGDTCQKQTVCPVVPETDYEGTSDVKPKIYVTVCFADREYGYITRPNGTNEWVVHLRYENGGGFDRIATMHNTQCRLQGVVPGTTQIAVYVTCVEYTGWVSTSVITKHDDGTTVILERVSGTNWSYTPT